MAQQGVPMIFQVGAARRPGLSGTTRTQKMFKNVGGGKFVDATEVPLMTSPRKDNGVLQTSEEPAADAMDRLNSMSMTMNNDSMRMKDLQRLNGAPAAAGSPAKARLVPKSVKQRWMKMSDAILRFRAYFQEAVTESAIETNRKRLVVISFFLEDFSISIVEPNVHNSGIVGGHILKRTVIRKRGSGGPRSPRLAGPATDEMQTPRDPRAVERENRMNYMMDVMDNRMNEMDARMGGTAITDPLAAAMSDIGQDFYTPDDFVLGAEVEINGISYHLYECDEYTRRYYRDAIGYEQGPNEVGPKAGPIQAMRPVPPGGAAGSTLTPRQRRMRQQVTARTNLKNQSSLKAVLRYYGVWDDTLSDNGFVHLLQINYYLDTGEVEIRDLPPEAYRRSMAEMMEGGAGPLDMGADDGVPKSAKFKFGSTINLYGNKDNSNRLDKSVLLLRRQRVFKEHGGMGTIYGERSDDLNCFSEDDFVVGRTVTISNRRILVCCADTFTYSWFMRTRGVDMEPDAIDPLDVLPKAPSVHVSNVGNSRRDKREQFLRQSQYQGTYLSYGARPQNPDFASGVDVQFLIKYHLGDNSMRVIMNAPANTGVRSGLFLKRNVIINPDTERPYTPEELTVGALVKLPQVTLVIDTVDRSAGTFNRTGASTEEHWTLFDTVQFLKRKLRERGVCAREIFRRIDENHDQMITFEEFVTELKHHFPHLPDHVVASVFRYFDQDGGGVIDFSELCEVMEHPDEGVPGEGAFLFLEDMSQEEVQQYVKAVQTIELSGHKEKEFIEILKSYSELILQIEGRFAAMGGIVDYEAFRALLMDEIHMREREVDILLKKFVPRERPTINVRNFMKVFNFYLEAKKKGRFL